MKILADENIPQVKEAFSQFGEVKLTHGRYISNEMLKEIDILVVRSITNVNGELLDKTNVKIVGTATIGTDHIDKEYLKSQNVFFADAAGCNSFSVAEYVIAALTNIFIQKNKSFEDNKIGVVGFGNIGTKIVRFAQALGFKTIINDPPLERKLGKGNFRQLKDALNCDVVTFHVPLNKSGIDNTYYLLNEENLDLIKPGTLLINTSRGPVVKNSILKNRLFDKKDINVVFDVWENEPNIDLQLLELADIGTAHIAGYSLEGKLNGSYFIYKKLCEQFNINAKWQPVYPEISEPMIEIDSRQEVVEILFEICKRIYDINFDSQLLKKSVIQNVEEPGKYFDQLRKTYRVRREFNNYTIKLSSPDERLKSKLETLRFKVI
ncbi:MAG: 4-phosphoerythronate dehydrogenase [Melioribacteraceae bacterium]|nr:4-phosphoerythronate dehydrogenase [Melioribacteraceae bacterium]